MYCIYQLLDVTVLHNIYHICKVLSSLVIILTIRLKAGSLLYIKNLRILHYQQMFRSLMIIIKNHGSKLLKELSEFGSSNIRIRCQVAFLRN